MKIFYCIQDEKRLAIKKSKEDLEHWLLGNEKVKPTLAYRKADAMFSSEQLWRAVSDSERREIFQDVLKAVTKRDEENKKTLRERNIKLFSDLLDAIPEIDYKTTWATAQQYIANNAEFSKDSILQGCKSIS